MGRQDAGITHTSRVCQEANELFCVALSRAIVTGEEAEFLCHRMLGRAEAGCSESLVETVRRARQEVWDEKAGHTGWVRSVLDCRPEAGRPNVTNPRPEVFWAGDALDLAEQLLRF